MPRILNMMSKFSAVLLLLLCSLALKAFEPDFLTALQLQTFDLYQHAKPRAYEDLPVKIIDIDDASLAKIGQWPWPRTQVAELVRALGEAGVSAIAFDMVFAEPDRTSPKHMGDVWKLEDRQILDNLPDHDDELAKELAKWPVVVGSVLDHKSENRPATKSGVAFVGGNPLPLITEFEGSIVNLPAFEKAATGNGMFNSDPGDDGVLRKVPLVFRIADKVYPALSTEALRVAQGAGSIIIKSVGTEGTEFASAIEAIKIGGAEVPTDANGKFWVYYDHSRPARYIPAWQVMAGAVEDDQLAGKIILIGTSAPGLNDLRSTPLNPVIAGVEVHAQIIEQILQEINLLKPDWGLGVELLLIITFGLFALWVSTRFSALISAFGLLASLSGILLASWYAFDKHMLLLEPITASLTVILVYFFATVWRFAKTERDKSQIRNTFGLYVSKDLVDELANNPNKLKLGGEKKDITILFCDIRSFSAISERLDPEVLTRLMNSYLTPMTDIILSTGGTIDKYMGDAIMAIWNAPLDVDGHPDRALQASLAMRTKLDELNQMWYEDPSVAMNAPLPIRFGIGINSGECSVGNMGSNQRFEYSVLGNQVDLASRLEGLSKYYGVDIVISEHTNRRSEGATSLRLDTIRVKGKEEALGIYTVLADSSLAENPTFKDLLRAHKEMLDCYKQGHWREAEASIVECKMLAAMVPLMQLGTLYNLYETRIEEHRLTPPENWDGVFTADFK